MIFPFFLPRYVLSRLMEICCMLASVLDVVFCSSESVVKELNTCAFCGCPFKVGNHSVKLLPRQPVTQKVLVLMQKFAKSPRSLGCYQQKLVQDYKSSRNKLVRGIQ